MFPRQFRSSFGTDQNTKKRNSIFCTLSDEKNIQFGASLVGRLARTDLPLSHGLQPPFEAISNSLHAIEEWMNA
jgi:hypothetical protein